MSQVENRKVTAADARRFALKADEFLSTAANEYASARYTSCGLAAVHAAISAADAVTAMSGGRVNSGADHKQVVGLLRSVAPGGLPGSQERQLIGLIRSKNGIEYSGTLLTEVKARTLLDQATRFVAWSRSTAKPGG